MKKYKIIDGIKFKLTDSHICKVKKTMEECPLSKEEKAKLSSCDECENFDIIKNSAYVPIN